MTRLAPIALALACTALTGCVAAIAPIVAAGAVGTTKNRGQKITRPAIPTAATGSATAPQVADKPAMPAVPSGSAAPRAAVAPSAGPLLLPTHDWRAMVVFVANAVQAKARPINGAVLAPDATVGAPRFLPCGAKPFAVIVDAEGTVLPPLDAPPGTTVGTDEAVRSLNLVRFGQVTVIFTSASPPERITATATALERARLGPAMQGRELVSAVDGPAGASKAVLRAAVADHYCVLALIGDAPEDFSDLLAASGGHASDATRWGAGWFRVPAQIVVP